MGLTQNERSGTPLESRRAAEQAGRVSTSVLHGHADPLGPMRMEAIMNLLGFDPRTIGTGGAAEGALRDPTDRTRGLFSSMEPFERRETNEQVAGVRSLFGGQGARFSSNLAAAETDVRGRMGETFGRNREQALLSADQNRTQALSAILQSILGGAQAANIPIEQAFRFSTPGAPAFEASPLQQILGMLMEGGSTLGAAKIAGGRG